MRLLASRVWVEHDAAAARVGFADASDPPTFVVLTRDLAPSQITRKLGMDRVYLEVASPGSGAYDAASAYSFDGRVLRIVVSQAALRQLDLTGDLSIELIDPELSTDDLRAALAAIFATEP